MRRSRVSLPILAGYATSVAASADPGMIDKLDWTLDSPGLVQTGDGASLVSAMQEGGSYAISDRNLFGDGDIWYSGFLTGMRSSTKMRERFAEPLGNPLFFESPFIDTNARALYLWHDFPSNGQIGGGQLNAWALQLRFALTDRLALIAPKDGWSDLNAGILPRNTGWNDFSVGLKYALIVDEADEFILTTGMRWEWHNGNTEILQGRDGGSDELSPFVSFAKAFGPLNFIGSVNARIPFDGDAGNHILSWDLHFDYEVAPDTLPGFHPLLEIHALHYLSDGDRFPVDFGGLDYDNIGASDVAGSSVFWGDLGFRWKLTPNMSVGMAYGFPISNPGNDIFNQRVTMDFIFRF